MTPNQKKLLDAISNKNSLLVQEILEEKGENSITLDELTGIVNNQTFLHHAAKHGTPEILNLLMEKIPPDTLPIILNLRSATGVTVLHLACLYQNAVTVKVLLDKGAIAVIHYLDDEGNTVLHYAACQKTIRGKDILHLLLENDTIHLINKLSTIQKRTPLHFACMAGNLDAVELLLSRGAQGSIHRADIEKKTPLYYSTDYNEDSMVELLLAYGASKSINHLSKEGTPLHHACTLHKPSLIYILFRHGAYGSVFIKDGFKNKPEDNLQFELSDTRSSCEMIFKAKRAFEYLASNDFETTKITLQRSYEVDPQMLSEIASDILTGEYRFEQTLEHFHLECFIEIILDLYRNDPLFSKINYEVGHYYFIQASILPILKVDAEEKGDPDGMRIHPDRMEKAALHFKIALDPPLLQEGLEAKNPQEDEFEENARTLFLQALNCILGKKGIPTSLAELEAQNPITYPKLDAKLENLKAVALFGENEEAYVHLGGIFVKQKKWQDALDAFKIAYKLNPQNLPSLDEIAETYYELNKPQESLQYINKAIDIEPTAMRFFKRARYYWSLGQYEMALRNFQKGIDLNPKDPLYFFARAKLYNDIGDVGGALKDIKKAENLGAPKLSVAKVRGQSFYIRGDYHNALQEFNMVLNLTPMDLSAIEDHGLIMLALGKFKEAIEDFEKIIKLDPKNTSAYFNLSYCLEKQDKSLKGYEYLSNYYGQNQDELDLEGRLFLDLNPSRQMKINDEKKHEENRKMPDLAACLKDYIKKGVTWPGAYLHIALAYFQLAKNEKDGETSSFRAAVQNNKIFISQYSPFCIDLFLRDKWLSMILEKIWWPIDTPIYKSDPKAYQQSLLLMMNSIRKLDPKLWIRACLQALLPGTFLGKIFYKGTYSEKPTIAEKNSALNVIAYNLSQLEVLNIHEDELDAFRNDCKTRAVLGREFPILSAKLEGQLGKDSIAMMRPVLALKI